ncbi:hypothetical protein GJ496_000707 [Pomphorhynchus laevis]|nr:hypothetical protein GJ496_000707 [Pomphorhynchus laevis]
MLVTRNQCRQTHACKMISYYRLSYNCIPNELRLRLLAVFICAADKLTSSMPSDPVMQKNVFFYVPNLIGYVRILLLILFIFTMSNNCIHSIVYYLVSAILDAVDGHAARYYNQVSQFGSMLDMLTDRCATMSLAMAISAFTPHLLPWFTLWVILDISSHWFRMQSALLANKSSHKSTSPFDGWLLQWYYNSKICLFFLCSANELFLVCVYASSFYVNTYLDIAICILLIPFSIKTWINFLQLCSAAYLMTQCKQDID